MLTNGKTPKMAAAAVVHEEISSFASEASVRRLVTWYEPEATESQQGELADQIRKLLLPTYRRVAALLAGAGIEWAFPNVLDEIDAETKPRGQANGS